MPRVRLFHWKAAEAEPLIALLRAAGHVVEYDETAASLRKARKDPPAAFVIDLTRMPSHGREAAIAARASKSTRHVPIVFVDGEPGKTAKIRQVLPDAIYTARAKLAGAVKTAIAKPPADPVIPTQMMDRYAHRSVAQKLGIGDGARVGVIDPPPNYAKALVGAPAGVEFVEDDLQGATNVLWFFRSAGELQSSLRRLRAAAAHARLWVLWRKKKRDGLDGNQIRRVILAAGLVDYKICAYDGAWSAMAVTVRRMKSGRSS